MVLTTQKRILTEKTRKKMLDKEVPWSQIPEKDKPLYEEAERTEWKDWELRGSVRVCSLNESKEVFRTCDPARIVGL